ncbi:hypothetical protein J2858_000926 [Neorhizobium galegae]|uniref:hypothetical protein n=1 Tax=Rhizobium/Agrobacterium group TaxID=227290 RepID=UPI001AE453DE|nr:hypothetical protein [Neorhizobium galegae]MBP2548033.1 hypothetical protein [Neorhizobium galegae]
MIKLVITGLWVCAVSLGAVYFSVKMSAPPPPVDEQQLMKDKSELVKGEVINVPVLANGAVQGYFITRISFLMDKAKVKGLHLPMTEMMTDELFTLLVGNRMVDLSDTKAFDLESFKTSIKTNLNKKLGEEYVLEPLVEQIDYLSKDDIRANADRPQGKQVAPTKIVEGVAPVAAPKSGH